MLPWLLSQTKSHLSAKWAQMDALNIPETFLRPEIGMNPVHEPLVRRDLTAKLDITAGYIWEEVGLALAELWGTEDAAWVKVNLDFTIRRVVARAANRVIVGDELCTFNIHLCTSFSHTDLHSQRPKHGVYRRFNPLCHASINVGSSDESLPTLAHTSRWFHFYNSNQDGLQKVFKIPSPNIFRSCRRQDQPSSTPFQLVARVQLSNLSILFSRADA